MNSVERIFQYGPRGNTPQEAAHEIDNSPAARVPGWPAQGNVEFRDVVMRQVHHCLVQPHKDSPLESISYRPGLPSVLKGISLHAKAGQKIGVVGR